MRNLKPGPVVMAVFVAEMVGLWVVIALHEFYGLALNPIDVRLNMVVFVTFIAWWTEIMGRQ